MKLYLYVLGARALPLPPSSSSTRSVHAAVRVGDRRSRTRPVRDRCSDPQWNEEFVFPVTGTEEETVEVGVYLEEEEGLLGGTELMGKVRLDLWALLEEEARGSLPPTWFKLRRKGRGRAKESVISWSLPLNGLLGNAGKILLSMSLYGRRASDNGLAALEGVEAPSGHDRDAADHPSIPEKRRPASRLGRISRKILGRDEWSASASRTDDSSSIFSDDISSDTSSNSGDGSVVGDFREALEAMSSTNRSGMPENLKGGVLIDKSYSASPKELTVLLFEPESRFRKDLAAVQGVTDYVEGPWMWKSVDRSFLTRFVTYVKGRTKFIKSANAIEEQTFMRADDGEFAVMASVTTPDIPYGDCFQVEMLYRITPGRRSPEGEETTRIEISWDVNFFQRTMMRSVIEVGTRQGQKDSYEQFEKLLDREIKPVARIARGEEIERLPLHRTHRSNMELATEYFWNRTVLLTIAMGLYILAHILLLKSSRARGLELFGLDLPDSFTELIVSSLFVLMCERVVDMVQHFVDVRLRSGNKRDVNTPGTGWLITVSLVEAINLRPSGSSESLDPYVVLMCNGKSRASSVQLQTLDPQWNEILEFEAMQDPPSIMDIEVYNYDGQFAASPPIGRAEVNFLRHSSAELADMWIPLEAKMAQVYKSKLHLRIFLDNTKGEEAVADYFSKMEEEVGKKLNPPPVEKISNFHKIFGLPSDEILVESFPCYLRRRMLLQGKLYLSARIVGFYSSFLGYRTKFFLLWEDIEDIAISQPSLTTVGCPLVTITLRKGCGTEARHGVKSVGSRGRSRFQFLPFVSYADANRMVMALWWKRSPPGEQIEEASKI